MPRIAAYTTLDHLLAAAAGAGAGAVNAIAGGGTLISFPSLVAIGVPKVAANLTNTVALCPGYFGGTWAQRRDLVDQLDRLRHVAIAAGLGGLTGSVLLVATGEAAFKRLVPWLILTACALLGGQNRIRTALKIGARQAATGHGRSAGHPPRAVALGATFAVSIYGGYFGAGLGIMLLAALGLLYDDTLPRLNALKQAMSLVINVVAALFFVASGRVVWSLAAVMAPATLAGGMLGGRLVGVIKPAVLRAAVVAYGTLLALWYLVR